MEKFKAGDLVERANGGKFSNGQLIVTVDHVESNDMIWLRETESYTSSSFLKLVKRVAVNIDDAIEVLNTRLNDLKVEADRIETAISVLKGI